MGAALAVGAAVALGLLAWQVFTGPRPDPVHRMAEQLEAPAPKPPPKRTVFVRPAPEAAEVPEPPAVQGLDALPRDEQLAAKNAAAMALGEAVEACDASTPPGFSIISVVTLDEGGLFELEVRDGAGAPLDLPDLQACLGSVLWEQDWPATSGPTRFGLHYAGSVQPPEQ